MKYTLKSLEMRMLAVEEIAKFHDPQNIKAYYEMAIDANRRIRELEQSETGRIRIEVQKMFKRVMTERDLFAFRIPWYKFMTRKIKNTRI